jgi:hypothetical protein
VGAKEAILDTLLQHIDNYSEDKRLRDLADAYRKLVLLETHTKTPREKVKKERQTFEKTTNFIYSALPIEWAREHINEYLLCSKCSKCFSTTDDSGSEYSTPVLCGLCWVRDGSTVCLTRKYIDRKD